MPRRVTPVAALVTLVVLLTAGVTNVPAQEATPAASPVAGVGCAKSYTQATPDKACVRFIEAIPPSTGGGANPVDIYLDGAVADANRGFEPLWGISPKIVFVAAGKRRLTLAAAGQPVAAGASASTLALAAGGAYEVLLTGTLAKPKATVFSVDLSVPPAGKGRFRFINADAKDGTMDVAVGTSPGALDPAKPRWRAVKLARATKYANLAAGPLLVGCYASGTGTALGSTLPVRLDPGEVDSLVVFGGYVSGTDPFPWVMTSWRTAPA